MIWIRQAMIRVMKKLWLDSNKAGADGSFMIQLMCNLWFESHNYMIKIMCNPWFKSHNQKLLVTPLFDLIRLIGCVIWIIRLKSQILKFLELFWDYICDMTWTNLKYGSCYKNLTNWLKTYCSYSNTNKLDYEC